jgi:hypothetical protein
VGSEQTTRATESMGVGSKAVDFYIRVFSASLEAPLPADLCAAAKRAGCSPAGISGAEPQDPRWQKLDLEYGGDRCPLRIERRIADSPGGFPEVARFSALIGKPGRAKAKKQVLEALAQSRQLIAMRIPDHVIVDEDWEMVQSLLRYLQPLMDGLIQVDAEGFYNGAGKLLELPEEEG